MKVLTANRLGDGVVVWWSAKGWSEDIHSALPLDEDLAAVRLQQAIQAETRVVGPYLVTLTPEGKPVARERVRETVRSRGPSIGATQDFTATRIKAGEAF